MTGDIADQVLGALVEDPDTRWGEPMSYSKVQEPEHIPYTRILRETEKAYLIRLEERDETNFFPREEWFPKSQVTIDEDEEEVLVPQWLAIEKGLV